MTSQKTILLTGGAGFIGANLIYTLLKRTTVNIHVFVRPETNLWRLKPIMNRLTIHNANLLDFPSLTKTVKTIQPTSIVHLAAYGGYSYEEDVQKMLELNIQATLNLLQATQPIDYKSFIHTGSSSEYGFKKIPMKETDVLEPSSFYAATKASATHLVTVWAKQYNKPIVTIRPFSVYGPREEKGRFVRTIVENLIQKKPLQVTSGTARRDFIFIDDVVAAYMKALIPKKNMQGSILNIGSGKEYTNGEVVDTLLRITGKTVPIQKGTYEKRAWDTNHWVANNTLANKLLSWTPTTSLEKGLEKTYRWYKKELAV